MTKAAPRKTTASRKAGQKRADSKAAPEPMDPSAREVANPEPITSTARVCYAAKTLLSEVAALFPDATYEDGERNGRGVLIGLTFELASLSEGDAIDLSTLLNLLSDPAHNEDPRIESVTEDEEEQLIGVAFRNDPRFYDLREPFGLADAMLVLAGEPDDDKGFVAENDEEGSR